jgi:hypothetical protein
MDYSEQYKYSHFITNTYIIPVKTSITTILLLAPFTIVQFGTTKE